MDWDQIVWGDNQHGYNYEVNSTIQNTVNQAKFELNYTGQSDMDFVFNSSTNSNNFKSDYIGKMNYNSMMVIV